MSSSLSENNISKENSELRLQLSHTPKFSVYFFSGINANLNQWSICDDFSEAQQVSSAYYAPGGSSVPHVLVGAKSSLEFLHRYLTTQCQNQSQSFNPSSLSQFEQEVHGIKEEGIHASCINDFETGPADYNNLRHEEADFQFKHDSEWHASPNHDHDFAMKDISPLGDFERPSQSPTGSHRSSINTEAKYSTTLTSKDAEFQGPAVSKPDSDYPDLFADTPDFFNTVQTPGSHQISSHLPVHNHDNLINSPSTSIRHLINSSENGNSHLQDTNIARQSSTQDDPQLDYSVPSFASMADQHDDIYNSVSSNGHDYAFAHISGNDFQPHDLLLGSPSMANIVPNIGNITHTGHEDQFIDYNGDA